jgi:hypothetical protein
MSPNISGPDSLARPFRSVASIAARGYIWGLLVGCSVKKTPLVPKAPYPSTTRATSSCESKCGHVERIARSNHNELGKPDSFR